MSRNLQNCAQQTQIVESLSVLQASTGVSYEETFEDCVSIASDWPDYALSECLESDYTDDLFTHHCIKEIEEIGFDVTCDYLKHTTFMYELTEEIESFDNSSLFPVEYIIEDKVVFDPLLYFKTFACLFDFLLASTFSPIVFLFSWRRRGYLYKQKKQREFVKEYKQKRTYVNECNDTFFPVFIALFLYLGLIFAIVFPEIFVRVVLVVLRSAYLLCFPIGLYSIFGCMNCCFSCLTSLVDVLEPQSGYFHNNDKYLKEAIQISCLFASLKDSKGKLGMIAAITQYLQGHVHESLPLFLFRSFRYKNYISDWTSDQGQDMIESMIDEVFGHNYREKEDGTIVILDPQDGEIPWHVACDLAFNNWRRFKDSQVMGKFCNLINVIVSAGLCSTSQIEFKLGNVHLFSPIVSKRQLAATDVFEAFYEAVSGFMRGGWMAYQTGNVSAFFSDGDEINAFDDMYNKIRSYHGYALAGNLLEYTDIDDNEYDSLLKKALEMGKQALQTIKKGQTFERKYVSDRIDKVRDYDVEFTQLRTRGGLRISPFSISLFGQSGCGKSTLTQLTVNAGLLYNDLSAAKDRIATWADNDKYASSVRSHINALIFDDFANTKESFIDFSPAYRLIQVINNIKYLAPMADVFLKGKVSLNPYFCIVSTNIEHLNAATYSNEPESVLRRLYHVKVEPKPEFCENGILNRKKVEAKFGIVPDPDVWFLSVRVYAASNSRNIKAEAFQIIQHKGKKLERISLAEYLDWVQEASKAHFEEERDIISVQEETPDRCVKCGKFYCKCEAILEPHTGVLETREFFSTKANILKNYFSSLSAESAIRYQQTCIWWERFDFLPESVICHPYLLKIGLLFWREDIKQSLLSGLSLVVLITSFLLIQFPRFSIFFVTGGAICSYVFICCTIQTYQAMVRSRILNLKDVVRAYTNQWQTRYALISLGAIAIVLAFFRSRRDALVAQTGLKPETIEEIEKRNRQVDPWLKNNVVPLPMSTPSKTTRSSDMMLAMRNNLVGLVANEKKVSLGFYLTSNMILVPTHFIDGAGGGDIDVRVYKNGLRSVGSYFNDKLSEAYRVQIPATDFSLCYLTGGGSMKDFTSFLPETDNLKRTPARLITRGITESILSDIPTLYEGSTVVVHTLALFAGGYYNLPSYTLAGMCMSPLISDSKGCTILGFHLGGKGFRGGCGSLTQKQAKAAIVQLSKKDGVVLSASSGSLTPNMGDFPKESFGKPICTSQEIHSKSATNYLTEGACIDVYGSTDCKSTPKSKVTATLISDTVAEIFGVPQKWGPPKMTGPGRYPYQATLVHAAVPSLPLGSVLAKSVKSIKDLSTSLKSRIPTIFNCSPLSRVQTVCGMPGVKFIDPMNFNTSPGFPMSGSKHALLVDLDPQDYPDIPYPRTFTSEIWDEFERVKDILGSGERCYTIWKSCLKDEPTKLEKDKVRVFQSAPLVLQLLIRMYFLPIVRIIQMNPILFECAVGVNAEGLEWEELWDAAMSKGSERVLAGDYSKYDVRMPAQVTLAAFDILIDMAEKCDGYTLKDLHIMRMMVHEVVYPVMTYNGDLIQLFGTNPSGQNLTVIINSLVNSLLLRSAFYTIYPTKDFKEECAFLTYGDDVIGTVSEDCGKFTHITYAQWLSEHDMKFTMPDKESEPKHYMHEDEVDFLKRRCVYNPDLGCKVGLLSEDSIFKRLHSHLSSKELTLQEHSATNIESSLHDWFYYGKEVFEERRSKLRLIAKKCEITHLCPALDVSYEKRVNHWRHKYLGEELVKEEEVVLDVQCGDYFVSTVDYSDQCIGTALDPFFWWEHAIADISLLFCHPVIWFLLSRGWYFKIGRIDKRWLYFLVLTTGGFSTWKKIFFLVLWTLVIVYVPLLCGKWYYNNVVRRLL